jgi:hypothetical protein
LSLMLGGIKNEIWRSCANIGRKPNSISV